MVRKNKTIIFHEDFSNMDISLTILVKLSNLKHAYMKYR